MWHRRAAALLALALTGVVAAHSAQATAPGRAGRIAYVSEPAFNGAFVESVLPAGGGSKRLSARLPHGSFGPSFAPDGRRIALTIQRPDALHVQILSGGRLRDLARGRAPAWSPDGRWIAFLSGQKVGSSIFLVRPDGTGLHAIGARHVALGATPPAWSPDGRTLVYARPFNGRQALWTIRADGTGSRLLVRGASSTAPSFAPDGRHIAYIGFDAKGRQGIWVVAADGRGARPLYRSPGSSTLLQTPVYSPDGRSLAFTSKTAWQRVAVMRATGGGMRFVSPRTKYIGGIDWARA
jgi:Tol biopolymer transport system component